MKSQFNGAVWAIAPVLVMQALRSELIASLFPSMDEAQLSLPRMPPNQFRLIFERLPADPTEIFARMAQTYPEAELRVAYEVVADVSMFVGQLFKDGASVVREEGGEGMKMSAELATRLGFHGE